MSETPATETPDRSVSLAELFSAFFLVGMLGFGGIAASGFYVIVERNRWLSRKDYVELFGVCSVLPGGNVLNASIILGDRYQGALGSIVALSALMLAPMAILLTLAIGFDRFSYLPDVRAAAAGAASAVAGVTIGTAMKMAHGLSRTVAAVVFGTLTFLAIAIFRLPLAAVVLIIAPMAVVTALVMARRRMRAETRR